MSPSVVHCVYYTRTYKRKETPYTHSLLFLVALFFVNCDYLCFMKTYKTKVRWKYIPSSLPEFKSERSRFIGHPISKSVCNQVWLTSEVLIIIHIHKNLDPRLLTGQDGSFVAFMARLWDVRTARRRPTYFWTCGALQAEDSRFSVPVFVIRSLGRLSLASCIRRRARWNASADAKQYLINSTSLIKVNNLKLNT